MSRVITLIPQQRFCVSQPRSKTKYPRAPLWVEGVSAIIPVRNQAALLPQCFRCLAECEVLEVIVCDLGSTDNSCAVAHDAGAHVFRGDSTIAAAINHAAQNARGSALWMLSPICMPPRYSGPHIVDLLMDPKIAGGYFDIEARPGSWSLWWRAWSYDMDAWLRGNIHIEQGPFISHGTFQRMGGCPEGPKPVAELMRAIRREYKLEMIEQPIRLADRG